MMDEQIIKQLKRAWGMTLVKEDAADDEFDSLYKISRILYAVICQVDVDFAEKVAWNEYEKRTSEDR